jgi:membrane-anchored protein YejM (alkaline phosphatase superfamily)
MRNLTNLEVQYVGGGEDIVTIEITGTRMTDEEKKQYDNENSFIDRQINNFLDWLDNAFKVERDIVING